MTDQTEMMTDDLMKNWLAGRKENQLEDTTETWGEGEDERNRKKEIAGKMDEYWIEMDQDSDWED